MANTDDADFLKAQRVPEIMNAALEAFLEERSTNPVAFFAQYFRGETGEQMAGVDTLRKTVKEGVAVHGAGGPRKAVPGRRRKAAPPKAVPGAPAGGGGGGTMIIDFNRNNLIVGMVGGDEPVVIPAQGVSSLGAIEDWDAVKSILARESGRLQPSHVILLRRAIVPRQNLETWIDVIFNSTGTTYVYVLSRALCCVFCGSGGMTGLAVMVEEGEGETCVVYNACEFMHTCNKWEGEPNDTFLAVGRTRIRPHSPYNHGWYGEPFDCPHIVAAVSNAADMCDIDVREEVLRTCIISGGGDESAAEDPIQTVLDVYRYSGKSKMALPENGALAAWEGAERLAPMMSDSSIYLSRDLYQSKGAAWIHRICP